VPNSCPFGRRPVAKGALANVVERLGVASTPLHLGSAAIAALSAPFPEVRFVPTGGVGPNNVGDYLRQPSVCAVGGSWMVPRDPMRTQDWATITELCREAVEMITRTRGAAGG